MFIIFRGAAPTNSYSLTGISFNTLAGLPPIDRYEYHLTEQGKDMAWLLHALAKVGTKWNLSQWESVPLKFVSKETGNSVRLTLLDEGTGQELGIDDVMPSTNR